MTTSTWNNAAVNVRVNNRVTLWSWAFATSRAVGERQRALDELLALAEDTGVENLARVRVGRLTTSITVWLEPSRLSGELAMDALLRKAIELKLA